MFSARAYSVRQKCRLAISLSWVGGYTNVVALLTCGSVVSHVTGTVTNLGRFAVTGAFKSAGFFAVQLMAFFFGTVLSAVLTESARRRGNASKYVMPITVELVLLAVFLVCSDSHLFGDPDEPSNGTFVLVGLVSAAMGIQNATITKISGAVVRTTHLTGVVTDLGLEGVQYIFWWLDNVRGRGARRAGRILKVSRRHPTALRLLVLLSIFGSFLFGSVIGTGMFVWWPGGAMLLPLLFLGWIIAIDIRTPIADVRELDMLSDPELEAHGIVKSLLPPQIGLYRSMCVRGARSHRAPNFQLWADHIPPHLRAVILAVGPSMKFTDNAVMDLEEAVKKLHERKCTLIISGVTVAQFKALDKYSVHRIMNVSNLCPDLEFAIARAMETLHHIEMVTPSLAAPLATAEQGEGDGGDGPESAWMEPVA